MAKRRYSILYTLCILGGSCSTDNTSTDGDNSPLEAAVSNWCADYCRWQEACGTGERESCAASCRSDGGFASYGRPEFYSAMGTCLQLDQACTGGADASWKTCSEAVSLQMTLTDAAYDFCADMATLLFECGYASSPDTCARSYIALRDDVLTKVSACRNETCDNFSNCITTIAFGGR